MKKIFALLLAVLLAMTATACSRLDKRPSDPNAAVGNQVMTPDDTTESDEDLTTSEEPDLSAPSFAPGAINGSIYESGFLKLGYRLPSGWDFYTDAEMRQLNNLTTNMLDEEIAQQLQQADLVYDMFASSGDDTGNVSVILEKNSCSPDNLETMLESSLPTSKQALENIGYTNVHVQMATVYLCGESCVGTTTTAQMQGVNMYQKAVALCNGEYVVSITATSLGENTTQGILDAFYRLG